MSDKKKGLLPKFHVSRTDGKEMGYAIVLELDDPLARRALRSWAKEMHAAGYTKAAQEITELIHLYDRVAELKEILRMHRELGRMYARQGLFLPNGKVFDKVKTELLEYKKLINSLENRHRREDA